MVSRLFSTCLFSSRFSISLPVVSPFEMITDVDYFTVNDCLFMPWASQTVYYYPFSEELIDIQLRSLR